LCSSSGMPQGRRIGTPLVSLLKVNSRWAETPV
jgi:hypothetical protein